MVKKAHHLLDGVSTTLGAPGILPEGLVPHGRPHGLPETLETASAPPKPARNQSGKSADIVAKKSQSFRHQGR